MPFLSHILIWAEYKSLYVVPQQLLDCNLRGEITRNSKYIQILCFWTLSIVLSLPKNRSVYFSKPNVLLEDGDRIQSSKHCVLKNKQDSFQIKTRLWIMSQNIIFVLMYHRHKLVDLIVNTFLFGSADSSRDIGRSSGKADRSIKHLFQY
jgi:hypothetical protein